ncbi:MAG: S9 family peptidase [Proteobacteria bacterium]|nr:S9 family peptidase [Pseudomonadota bacterium]
MKTKLIHTRAPEILRGVCLALGLCAAAVSAEEPAKFPSNEVMRHYRSIHDPQLSPDGKHALVRVNESAADGGKSHLWLIDIGGKGPRQLTFSPDSDKRGEQSGQWSPDGQSVLFLAHRGEHAGLYVLPMEGGEAKALDIKVRPAIDNSRAKDASPPAKPDATPEPIEDLAVDIESYNQSPDGQWIAFMARDPETPGEKKQKEAKADAEWVDHDTHGTRLYLLRRDTNKVTPIPIAPDIKEFAWKEDSSGLIAVAEGPHNAGDLGFARTSWDLSTADTEHPKQIALPASIETAVWSVDGRSVIFLAQSHRDAPPRYADLYESELGASATARNLTDGFDGSLAPEPPIALADGGIVQLVERGFDTRVGVFPAHTGKVAYVNLPLAAVREVRSNARRTGWLFLGSSGGQQPSLYYASDLNSSPQKLHTPEVAPALTRTVKPKRIKWKNEGLTIEGVLYLPPDTGDQRVPLIVDVHGGPTGQYDDRFEPFADFLVGHGWALLRTNPRGSTGYGAAFAAANKNDLGGADYRDIMTGVDYVLKTEHVDPTRMALMGYSYGGEMAGFVEGKTTRFKAIVSGAPVIDQYSEYGTEDQSWYDRWFYGKPWEHPADAWRQSPLAHIGAARTPFLLLQGQADSTDPVGQSQEMYRALRQNGVPVELVTYPRDDHGPLARALYGAPVSEPWHGFDARRRTIEFIEKAFATAGKR